MRLEFTRNYIRLGTREWFIERNTSGPWLGSDKQQAGRTVYLAWWTIQVSRTG